MFGHCGHAGLCVRGRDRVLCLGCPFLVPRPEYRWRAERYGRDYAAMADRLDADGNAGEAREYRHLAGQCTDLAHLMRRLEEAEADLGWRPLYRELPEGRLDAELDDGDHSLGSAGAGEQEGADA